ncbi:ARM REPEAT PROTEIN INTERACTING WITH ABF2-like [Leptopilina heterotoma]|uniref:ARM REPEAT PROTEIN INTERACTING WITH ABF2-like n=1 Tax=Leptopilina heterotoma TaxID=63436 RepID=UPI001CA83478|nr:ARM REPEAT PROTEIN INTERACTING WITH ABF2-like [Leptopilina heterotoma]
MENPAMSVELMNSSQQNLIRDSNDFNARYLLKVTKIKWIIQNFKVTNTRIFSHEFNIEGYPNKTCVIELINLKNSSQDSEFRFLLSDSSVKQTRRTVPSSITSRVQLNCINVIKIKLTIGQKPKKKTFCKLGSNLELNHIIKGNELKELVALSSNSLHVTLKIKPQQKQKSKIIGSPSMTKTLNFEPFFNNRSHSDVSFLINDNKFYAHKVILASASPEFERMFSHNMQEKIINSIEIKDTNSNHFKELLRHIYMGRVENLQNIAVDIFKLAIKYNVASLQQVCEIHLEKNFSINNAISIFELADCHNSLTLKEKCIEYIDKNFEQIKNTEAFKSLKSELLVDFVCAVRNKRPRIS